MQTIKQGLGYRWLIWEAIPEAQAREWGKWDRKRGKSIKCVLMGSLLNFTVTFRGTVWNMPHNCSIKSEGSWSIYTLTPIPHYLGVAPGAVIHLALLGCPTGRLNKPSGKKKKADRFRNLRLKSCQHTGNSSAATNELEVDETKVINRVCYLPLRLHVQGGHMFHA